MSEEVYVRQKEVGDLRDALSEAVNKFNENFKNLDDALNHLISSGLTGDAANSLLNTYYSKVKPDLESIKEETQKATDFAEDEVDATSRLMNNLEDIANQ